MELHPQLGLILGARAYSDYQRGEGVGYIGWPALRAAAYHLAFGGTYSTAPSHPLDRETAGFILANLDLIIEAPTHKLPG